MKIHNLTTPRYTRIVILPALAFSYDNHRRRLEIEILILMWHIMIRI